MSDVFVSYARPTARQAERVAECLRAAGYSVWRDDALPAHRAYGDVIEERLRDAKAVVVLWSADAARSEWVRSEANAAREQRKLVQLRLDGTKLPMPFDQLHCADLCDWNGDTSAPGWNTVLASVAALLGAHDMPAAPPGAAAAHVEAPVAAASPPGKPSIAVLPFSNLSGDPDQAYFADGIVLEIVDALSRSRSIFVIGSGSSMAQRGVGAREAARQLGVRYALEGNVRKAGARVRIGVQLVDALAGATIWSERFEGMLDDIFALQDDVALAVAGRIEPAVEQAEIRRAIARGAGVGGAHDLYLRALPRFRAYTKAETLSALALLHEALAIDASHAPALALAVSCHRTLALFGWADDRDACTADGIALAQRAVQAAGDDANVLASVASDLTVLERRLDVALPLARRAIELNPGSANVCFNCGCVRLMAGEHDVAREHFETAMRLDPAGGNRPAYLLWLAGAHFFARRFGEAVALLRERNQYGESPASTIHLAAALACMGDLPAAREALGRYRALTPVAPAEFLQMWLDPAQRALALDGLARLDPAGAGD